MSPTPLLGFVGLADSDDGPTAGEKAACAALTVDIGGSAAFQATLETRPTAMPETLLRASSLAPLVNLCWPSGVTVEFVTHDGEVVTHEGEPVFVILQE